jgi:hypothetical protein
MSMRHLIAAPSRAVWVVVAIALTTLAVVGGPAGAAVAAPANPPGGGLYAGTYFIENEWSHRCLDERSQDNKVSGARVQIYDCLGDPEQLWDLYLLPGGNGHTYQLVNEWSGHCLDAQLTSINRNGTVVQDYQCFGAAQFNQLWNVPLVSGSPVWITNMWTGFTSPWPDTLDEDNSHGDVNEAKVQLWQFVPGNTNQEWRVEVDHY